MPSHADPLAFPPEPPGDTLLAREQELVARVRAGDEHAFETLFTAYFPSLCNFVRGYVHTPDEAEELVQDVFLRIWQKRADWRPASVRAYLFGAARNSALTHQRHERVVARFEQAAAREQMTAGYGQPSPPPDAAVDTHELAEALRQAVQSLPERRRQIVVLRWEHQLSQAEIAQALGVSVRTVETQFARALRFLRARLAPSWR